MANVAETRVRITLTDAMSGPLRNIQGQLVNTNTAAASLERTFKDYASIGAGIMAGATGIYSLADKAGEIFGKGAAFAKNMETNTVGMAGILSSMTQINGKALDWNDAMQISSGIIKQLNDDALIAAGTSEELVETFRALLGPGLGAGMTIEQVQKFTTVGVNAVKSLGLEGRQLVQELRDLVQGGIQPASSTLATALGLRDKDIKAAKASSEGLYAFLMKRIEGFQMAAEATPKTLAGIQSQISEGLTRGISVGIQPLMDEYKDVLLGIKGGLISMDGEGNLSISENFAANLRTASEHVVNMWHGFENIAGVIKPVIVPAVGAVGDGLAFVMDNVDKIALGFGAWAVGSTVVDIYKLKTGIDGAYSAQTMLGQAVSKTTDFWNTSKSAAEIAVRSEMLAAENAATVVVQANNKIAASEREKAAVVKAVETLTKSGHTQLANRLGSLKEYYQQLGASAEQAGKMQYQAAKQAAKGNADLTAQIIRTQESHLWAANAAAEHGAKMQHLRNIALGAGSALGALSGTVLMLTDDTNSLTYSIANTGLAVSSGITAIGLLIEQLGNLATAYQSVATAAAGAGLLKATAIGAAGGLAIGAGVGLAAAGAYAAANDLSIDDMWKRWTYGKDDYDKEANAKAQEFAESLEKIEQQRKVKEAMSKAQELKNKFPSGTTADASQQAAKSAKKQEDAAKKAKYRFEKSAGEIAELSANLDRQILENTGSTFEISMAKLSEDVEKMKTKVKTAMAMGVDVSSVIGKGWEDKESKLAQFVAEEKKRINREKILDLHQQEMDYIDALEGTRLISAQRADELRAEEVAKHKEALDQLLADESLTNEQRLQLQQEYADAVAALDQARRTDWQASWDSFVDYIKNTQFDQLETLKGGWDEITGTITNFGQNMLTEQKSFSERCKDLYNDLANSIMNTMMKVIMQGLVMKSIMGSFGLGGGGATISSGVTTSMDKYLDLGYRGYANGGHALGWSLVGERGPELVNFEQPGRVYNAEQTARALKGSGSPENMKIVIENKSGTPVKATSASSSFNGKEYVLSVVVDAVATKEGGITDILKGAVGNY